MVSFVDRSLTYRFANAAYQEWFGRTPAEVVGWTIPEIAGAEDYAIRRALIERALAGETVQMDLDWPWPDRRRRIADIRYLPRRDAVGAVDGFGVDPILPDRRRLGLGTEPDELAWGAELQS